MSPTPIIQFGFDIRGVDEVQARFRRISDSLRARIAAALKTSADEIASRARGAVPSKTGMLRASIRASEVWGSENRLGVTIRPYGTRPGPKGARFGNYAVGLFAESGLEAKRQWVRGRTVGQRVLAPKPGRKRRATISVRGRGFYRSRPAIPARPFMGPAFLAVRSAVGQRINAAIEASLSEETT